MPYQGNDFQYDRGEAYVAITSGLHGEEMDGRYEELVELENGVRKHWADKLHVLLEQGYEGGTADLVDLLDPYSGAGDEDGFARTEYTGYGWVKP